MEGWGEEGGYILTSFFSIIYILGLVCYKHTIHAMALVLHAQWAWSLLNIVSVDGTIVSVSACHCNLRIA